MGVDVDLLTAFICALGDVVDSECSLVAAGGTALTFYDIKQSTEDVDFVVETGSMADVESAINAVNGPPTDLFSADMVFNNPLPPTCVAGKICWNVWPYDRIRHEPA